MSEETTVCQHCGETLPEMPPETLPDAPPSMQKADDFITPPTTIPISGSKFCKKCGGMIDKSSKKCTSCGKQYFRFPQRKAKTVGIILTVFALLALLGLNIFQYVKYAEEMKMQMASASAQEAKIETKIKQINRQAEEIDGLERELTTVNQQNKELVASNNKYSLKASYFDGLLAFLDGEKIGRASDDFYADTGIILVNTAETDKTITLTADWYDAFSVKLFISNYAVADVSFSKDDWTGSTTKLNITPCSAGVASVTFTNDLNDQTFQVLIIVVEEDAEPFINT
jgi:hypothetical protein